MTVIPECRASLNHNVFLSGILVEENIDCKQDNLRLNLKELFDVERMDKWMNFAIIEEQEISTKAMEIVEVAKKYQSKRVQKRCKTFGMIFGSLSLILTLFFNIATMICRCMRNRRNQAKESKEILTLAAIVHRSEFS